MTFFGNEKILVINFFSGHLRPRIGGAGSEKNGFEKLSCRPTAVAALLTFFAADRQNNLLCLRFFRTASAPALCGAGFGLNNLRKRRVFPEPQDQILILWLLIFAWRVERPRLSNLAASVCFPLESFRACSIRLFS